MGRKETLQECASKKIKPGIYKKLILCRHKIGGLKGLNPGLILPEDAHSFHSSSKGWHSECTQSQEGNQVTLCYFLVPQGHGSCPLSTVQELEEWPVLMAEFWRPSCLGWEVYIVFFAALSCNSSCVGALVTQTGGIISFWPLHENALQNPIHIWALYRVLSLEIMGEIAQN